MLWDEQRSEANVEAIEVGQAVELEAKRARLGLTDAVLRRGGGGRRGEQDGDGVARVEEPRVEESGW